jgi:hypothetical protein
MDRINTTVAAEKTMNSSARSCRGVEGARTRAKGPHKASVVKGSTKPKTNTPDDCKIRRRDIVGDERWRSMSKPRWRRGRLGSDRGKIERLEQIYKANNYMLAKARADA